MECFKSAKPWQCLNGAQLKYLAFASMFIDHMNNSVVTPYLSGGGPLLYLSNFFSILGRIAFPIFFFFLVEGFFQTHSRKAYMGNLLLFGILSEVPFDLFTSKVFFDPYWNNIFFSLALGLATIWLVDWLKGKLEGRPKVFWYLASLPILLGMGALSMYLSLDYDYHAILLAYLFYLFRKRPLWGSVLGYLSILKELWSFLGFGLVLTYNGQRGKQYKWLNYAFYPAHLLFFALLRFALGV
ncbi:conjugal transfer protein TrbP [Urinicoccus massiliensis]|uniref:Conjugal transfer protein TrbP n=1 Tax=Urinicoccus massiliensis TaxID=1723382 RepID=A0A8H2QY75_9FIRM|nr:TraX family protein [Urinicoccus massiliensis]VFB16514.1 conjugal transfer protein TrbP [Urinicoccus massiliensis]